MCMYFSMMFIRTSVPISTFMSLDESGKLIGPVSTFFKDAFYYLFQKFNYSISDTNSNLCSEPSCLARLTQDKVDFDTGLYYLPELPENVTTGPVITEIACYVMTNPKVSSKMLSVNYVDSLRRIEFDTVVLMVLMGIVLILMACYKNRRMNIWTVSWAFLCLFFRNLRNLANIENFTRMIVVLAALFFLLFQMIFSTFIRIEMTQANEFQKTENLQDIKRYNMDVWIFNYLPCQQVIRWQSQSQNIPRRLKLIQGGKVNSENWFQKIAAWDSRVCLIGEAGEIEMIHELMCLRVGSTKQTSVRLYHSAFSVIRAPRIAFLSTNLHPDTKKALTSAMYSSFETGNNIRRPYQSPKIVRHLLGSAAKQSCLRTLKIDSDIFFGPLRFSYFSRSLALFGLLIYVACIILSFEKIAASLDVY